MNWPVLFDALKTFSIVGLGGWGITLLKQQNELLKADKSLKESEINLHKARIEHLESRQAPAISRELDQVSRTAEKLAEEKQKLEEQVKALEAESAKAVAERKVTNEYLLGYARASLEAVGSLEKAGQMATGLVLLPGGANLVQQINESSRTLIEQTRSALGSEWWKIQNPPTKDEVTKISPPDFDSDF
jgi:hypothetical protein